MKNIFIACILSACSVLAHAEFIKILTPYSASHSGTPALLAVIEEANRIQKNYTFALEPRPGANQLLSVQEMDRHHANSLSVVAASIVENHELGRLNLADYAAVYSLGDACWAAMSTIGQRNISSMRTAKEIVVGTVGIGNATHLTALEIGAKYNIPVLMVPFKSNADAVINMAGGHGVNFGIDRVETFLNLADRNTQLSLVGVSCPKRLPAHPTVPTLAEQGIQAPYVFNIVVANRRMPANKQQQIGAILNQATVNIGEARLFELGGFVPAVFTETTAEQHLAARVQLVQQLRNRYREQITNSR
jgi:hypothetical protein